MNVTADPLESIQTYNGSDGVLKISKPLNLAMNVLSIIILFVTMISLGCTMELCKIKAHLLKPRGVIIALLAQFCIMPVTAFCLAKIMQWGPLKAVMVLICGCCPGGTLSNVFALLVQGDMNLSIVMTTCSSVMALGLMPLLLYIYSRGFPGLENAVPYVGIITTLVYTLVPCAIGISINHYRPKYSSTVMNVGLIMLAISTIALGVLAGFAVKDVIWMIFMPDVLAVAALMPLIGFVLGYVMALIWKLSPACSRTIAMETGCQNIQLCSTILKVAFPPQVIGPMFLFPLIYITFQCLEALLLSSCFRCYQTLWSPRGDARALGNVNTMPEETKLA